MKYFKQKILGAVVLLVLLVLLLAPGVTFAKTTSQLVQDYGQKRIQCFAPRGPLTFTSTPTNITSYLAVKFCEDATATITWKDDTTTEVSVTAGETWAIDDNYIKSIATAASTSALWM